MERGNFNFEDIDKLFADFSGLDNDILVEYKNYYQELFNQSTTRITKYFSESDSIGKKYESVWGDIESLFKQIPLTYHDEVFSFIQDINEKVEKGVISKAQATQFASGYTNLFNRLSKILDPSVAK